MRLSSVIKSTYQFRGVHNYATRSLKRFSFFPFFLKCFVRKCFACCNFTIQRITFWRDLSSFHFLLHKRPAILTGGVYFLYPLYVAVFNFSNRCHNALKSWWLFVWDSGLQVSAIVTAGWSTLFFYIICNHTLAQTPWVTQWLASFEHTTHPEGLVDLSLALFSDTQKHKHTQRSEDTEAFCRYKTSCLSPSSSTSAFTALCLHADDLST